MNTCKSLLLPEIVSEGIGLSTVATGVLFCSGLCGMKDLISPIREPMAQTRAACSGSTESKALDHQGNPKNGDWF